MNYLAIDTSAAHLTVLLHAQGRDYCIFEPDCRMEHSVRLMPAVEQILQEAGCAPASVDAFCCVVGAGSFTGVRIGVSAVKGLADALHKKKLGVTSFDTLAYHKETEKVLCILDAKHGSYYVCGYDRGVICLPPAFLSEADVLNLRGEYQFVSGTPLAIPSAVVDPAEGLKRAVEKNLRSAAEDFPLEPLYIRKSQAEEGR